MPEEDIQRLLLFCRGGKKNRDLLEVKDDEGKTRYIHFPLHPQW